MNYYLSKIQYRGDGYCGFQYQDGLKTIQGEFNRALHLSFAGKMTTVGTSRTDSGVHALEQFVKITSQNPLNLESFQQKINSLLPSSIRCLNIQSSSPTFRPASMTKTKEYHYYFTNNLSGNEASHFIANISNPLNYQLMQECAHLLIGCHDFSNFYSQGSNVRSTIREIFSCDLSIVNPQELFFNTNPLFPIPPKIVECYQLRIEANGFLKQMIRHIVSSLWMIGSGKITLNEYKDLIGINEQSKKIRWKVAPASGLYLVKINF